MKRTISLNGSVQKDLTKIIQAVSEIKYAHPTKSVSLTFSSNESISQNRYSEHVEISRAKRYPELKLADNELDRQRSVLFVAGTGTVGSEILRQLAEIEYEDFNPAVIGICNSKRAVWNSNGFEKQELMSLFEADETNKVDWDQIISRIINIEAELKIFVDATGSSQVSDIYETLLENNVSVVTPNKLANSGKLSRFKKLHSLTGSKTFYKYETTAGAGLPIINTIRNLRLTGDSVSKISGVLSGTITYIFEAIQNGVSFSEAVKNAAEKGYSEPDPRDDLSGEDVARKFLILSRVAGYEIEREDLIVDNQTPAELRDVSLDEFFEKLPEYDNYWKERTKEARKNGDVLRYIGELKEGKIEVGVRAVPADSPLGNLRGTDNQVAIYTRYYQSPIIIQGPGAGKEVTAQGVIADIREIADSH